jgi:uncharacterized integral membrane protein
MSVSSALDVAIGLAFLFFLFSLVISRINEYVATALNLRHKGLENALRAMLDDHSPAAGEAAAGPVVSADKVLNHALVKPIQQAIQGRFLSSALGKLGLGRTKISYLPSRTFSAAVFDLLAPADPAGPADPAHPGATAGKRAATDPMARAKAAVEGMSEHNPARQPLLRMMTDAEGDRDKFRGSLEHWYDDTMDRVSGWYKRYVQRIILVITIMLVACLNVDTINIAQVLWRLPTERAAVAAAAAKQAGSGSAAGQNADEVVRSISALKLPLGWTPPHVTRVSPARATTVVVSTDPQHLPLGLGSWLIKLLGLLITVLALSLGAPFWFDALTKLGSLRQAGPKPAKSARSS